MREQTLRTLRKLPGLQNELRTALQLPAVPGSGDTRKFLALDVIGALKLTPLLPDLLRLAATDTTGFSVHALNALITPENRTEITAFYRSRALDPTTRPAARIAFLDTLARLESRLTLENLESLISSREASEGVRAAALHYVRHFLVNRGDPEFLRLLDAALEDPAPLNRLQAIHLFSELPSTWRRMARPWLATCLKDPDAEARSLCERFARETPGDFR